MLLSDALRYFVTGVMKMVSHFPPSRRARESMGFTGFEPWLKCAGHLIPVKDLLNISHLKIILEAEGLCLLCGIQKRFPALVLGYPVSPQSVGQGSDAPSSPCLSVPCSLRRGNMGKDRGREGAAAAANQFSRLD